MSFLSSVQNYVSWQSVNTYSKAYFKTPALVVGGVVTIGLRDAYKMVTSWCPGLKGDNDTHFLTNAICMPANAVFDYWNGYYSLLPDMVQTGISWVKVVPDFVGHVNFLRITDVVLLVSEIELIKTALAEIEKYGLNSTHEFSKEALLLLKVGGDTIVEALTVDQVKEFAKQLVLVNEVVLAYAAVTGALGAYTDYVKTHANDEIKDLYEFCAKNQCSQEVLLDAIKKSTTSFSFFPEWMRNEWLDYAANEWIVPFIETFFRDIFELLAGGLSQVNYVKEAGKWTVQGPKAAIGNDYHKNDMEMIALQRLAFAEKFYSLLNDVDSVLDANPNGLCLLNEGNQLNSTIFAANTTISDVFIGDLSCVDVSGQCVCVA